ncbi:hypothetical protein PFLUV_G00150800 [Perca fluviatilis]|uniref:Uncharacterized protein n=1 Tax=Perca fluviatilis TaxID=8168 RepID=A0A6A5EXL9_PERFL|nr:hypothetical protein PFLUV_G00150800 [Perca fluviatilis]
MSAALNLSRRVASPSAPLRWLVIHQPVACHSQLIIVEQRGQAPPADRHVVIVTGQSEGREVFVIPSNQLAVISRSPTGPVDPDCSSQPPREQPAAGRLFPTIHSVTS